MSLSSYKKISRLWNRCLTKSTRRVLLYSGLFLLASCSPAEKPFTGVKIGKPYEINGKTYYPASDSSYDKIGDASWYGPGFDGRRTANGEVFDQDDITAAHPTLPMPSLVRVTNLSNEKSIIVRINDRGPFHKNRIIDLSKKSAEMIDLKSTQPVRVQYLNEETEDYIASIQGKSAKIDMVAYNESYDQKASGRNDPIVAKIAEAENAPNYNSNYNNDTFSNGGAISNFAPMQSVASNDLQKPEKPEATKPVNLLPPIRRFIISDALADENVASPRQQASPPTEQHHVTQSPPASENKYIIAAGSFSSKDNANKLADTLSSVMDNKNLISVDKVEAVGKEWWRVQVGAFSDRDKAEETLKIVRNIGVPDAHINRR